MMSIATIEQSLGENYLEWRRLEDGEYIALLQLMFTLAIVMECDECGYARRYCFDDLDRARAEYEKIKSIDDEPTGWIAKRGA